MSFAFNATLADFGAEQTFVLVIINYVVSSLSLLGSLFIVFLYLYFKNQRRLTVRLVFILSLSDIGICIANLLGDPNSSIFCYVQGFMTSFFRLSSVLWTLCIAVTMYIIVVKGVALETLERVEWSFHVGCWGLALLMSLLPFTTSSYGDSGAWCWIVEDLAGQIWRLFQFFIFLWAIFIINTVLYVLTMVHVKDALSMFGGAAGSALKRMSVYPLLLVLSFSWATVNRIQNFIHPHEPYFWLYVLHIVFAGLNGLFNALAYSTAPQMRRLIHEEARRLLNKLCCGRYYSGGRFAGNQSLVEEGGVLSEQMNEEDANTMAQVYEVAAMMKYKQILATGTVIMQPLQLHMGDSPRVSLPPSPAGPFGLSRPPSPYIDPSLEHPLQQSLRRSLNLDRNENGNNGGTFESAIVLTEESAGNHHHEMLQQQSSLFSLLSDSEQSLSPSPSSPFLRQQSFVPGMLAHRLSVPNLTMKESTSTERLVTTPSTEDDESFFGTQSDQSL